MSPLSALASEETVARGGLGTGAGSRSQEVVGRAGSERGIRVWSPPLGQCRAAHTVLPLCKGQCDPPLTSRFTATERQHPGGADKSNLHRHQNTLVPRTELSLSPLGWGLQGMLSPPWRKGPHGKMSSPGWKFRGCDSLPISPAPCIYPGPSPCIRSAPTTSPPSNLHRPRPPWPYCPGGWL